MKNQTKVTLATWICSFLVISAFSTSIFWACLVFIPFVGLIALPSLVASFSVLVYALPTLAYLTLAQTHPPSHVKGLFLPLNPVRNLSLLYRICVYVSTVLVITPSFLFATVRYLLWKPTRWETSLHGENKSAPTVPGVEGSIKFGIPYQVLSNDGTLYLDLYLPPPLSVAPTSPPESLFASSPITHNTAPDIDSASDTGSQSDDWRLVPPDPESPSPVPTSQAQHQDLPELHIPRDETFSGKKTMIFVYDVGMMGPIRPRKEMFCLLGIKLAELGYLVVIPDITVYPDGGAEQMVGDLRQVLNWVSRNIQAYGGSSNDINICGHGLGAHLAMFTLAQDAVVRSRDKKQEREIHRVLPSRLWGNEEKIVPNGLRTMQIYSEEVEIPTVAGIILLSPIADIIKQIRHESLGWLEHVSPVRRALGPSQTVCMQDSLGHLLFAAKNVLEPERMPKHVMIIHGGHDTVVPLESSHWLSEVLNGLDIKTTFRPYFSLGHLDLLTSLMKGLEKEFTEVLLHDFQT